VFLTSFADGAIAAEGYSSTLLSELVDILLPTLFVEFPGGVVNHLLQLVLF
jgi:hypothetical protein